MPVERVPEFRSEELQEVIGKPPGFILRSGIWIMFCFIILLLLLSYFIKYPDSITSRILITTEQQPIHQKARTEGQLRLLTPNNATVTKDQIVAFIDNGAVIEDVQYLIGLLPQFKMAALGSQNEIASLSLKSNLSLGQLQAQYLTIVKDLNDINTFWNTKKYNVELAQLRQRFSYYGNLTQQLATQKNQYEQLRALAYKEYRADSILEKQQVIAPLQLNSSMAKLNQANLSVQNITIASSNNDIQMSLVKEQIIRLEQQMQAEVSSLITRLSTDIEQLASDLEEWKKQFLFVAPFNGTVSFSSFWQNKQYINTGDDFASFLPKDDSVQCLAYVPTVRSGKINVGNKVFIQLDNYPNTEYGRLVGVVSKISLVPTNGNYLLTINLPNKLRTTYKKDIPFKQEMEGSADIITQDLRIIERIFNKFKSIFDKSVN